MPRLAAALLLAVALAACGDSTRQECPGTTVAVLAFDGSLVTAGAPALAGLDPNPAALDCAAEVGYPTTVKFSGLLSVDPNGAAAALCKERGVVLFGQRTGSRYVVELGTAGAVLGTCAATCSALMRLTVAGDVSTSPEGEVTGFTGALVETMSPTEGASCGDACTLPCEARYVLAGVP